MRIVQSNNAAIILTRERFMLKSRNEEEIVYSAKVARRIGAITSLIVLGSLMVYVHMQVLRFFGLILCLCIIISKYFWAFSIFRRWRHAWNPIETIAMDRINHAVTIRSLYFLTAPNNVEFSNKNVSEDIVDRMEWYGKPISYWRVWLYETDGGYKLIDQGHKKGPIQNLAADLAEVLHVPLLQIL